MNASNDIELDTVPTDCTPLEDEDLPPYEGHLLKDFEEYYHRKGSPSAWYDFPGLIALSCLLLCGLVIFPALYMHHLTELPMDAVTDATGSVYTGGILWRLTCIVCLIFLLLISMLSPATLGGEGYTLCIFLGLAEFVVAFIVWGAVSSEPTLETDEGCVGKGDLCVSHGMFYASLFAQIVFANVACVFGLLWWHHEEDVWELRREIVGLRDLIRSRWQADRNPL